MPALYILSISIPSVTHLYLKAYLPEDLNSETIEAYIEAWKKKVAYIGGFDSLQPIPKTALYVRRESLENCVKLMLPGAPARAIYLHGNMKITVQYYLRKTPVRIPLGGQSYMYLLPESEVGSLKQVVAVLSHNVEEINTLVEKSRPVLGELKEEFFPKATVELPSKLRSPEICLYPLHVPSSDELHVEGVAEAWKNIVYWSIKTCFNRVLPYALKKNATLLQWHVSMQAGFLKNMGVSERGVRKFVETANKITEMIPSPEVVDRLAREIAEEEVKTG